MSQISRPTAISSPNWSGTAAAIADDSDATYCESQPDPTPSQVLLVTMQPLLNPGVTTGHTLTVRMANPNTATDPLRCDVEILNGTTNIVIGGTSVVLTATPTDVNFTLSAAQVALLDYTNIKVRISAHTAVVSVSQLGTVAFTASVDHATVTSYTVKVYNNTDTVVATENVGKPTPAPPNNQIVVDETALFGTLTPGLYTVGVAATSPGGTTESARSSVFSLPLD